MKAFGWLGLILVAVLSIARGGDIQGASLDTVFVSSVAADPGASGVHVPVYARVGAVVGEDLDGVNFGLSYDPSALVCDTVIYEVTDPTYPSFYDSIPSPFMFTPRCYPDSGWTTTGIIFSMIGDEDIPPGYYRMFDIVLDVKSGATPGDYVLHLDDQAGSPPIGNYFTHNITVEYFDKVDGTFTIIAHYGDIFGKVRNAWTSDPLEGAVVTARGKADTTDANGNYRINHILVGTVDVVATAEGFYPDTAKGILVRESFPTRVNFSLSPKVGAIGGKVVDGWTDDPLEGAVVSTGEKVDTTDANGDYLIEDLLIGSYDVTVTADGYRPDTSLAVVVVEDETVTVDFGLTPRYGAIGGTVTDAWTTGLLEGVVVSAGGRVDTTDVSGGYFIDSLRVGSYDVKAEVDGYYPDSSLGVGVSDGVTTPLSFALTPFYGAISGVVTNAQTSEPVEGVLVTADGASDVTGPDGRYLIDSLLIGDYDVVANRIGYQPDTVTSVGVNTSDTTIVDFTLIPEYGAIGGIVTDAWTTDPIEGAIVTVDGIKDTTDALGKYLIDSLLVGYYEVSVTADQYYLELTPDVAVVKGETTYVDYPLTPRYGAVGGIVRDDWTTYPLEGAVVSVNGRVDTTDATGEYLVDSLRVSTYDVYVDAAGYYSRMIPGVEVIDGETTSVDLGLTPYYGAIAGVVTHAETGDSIEGAVVTVDGKMCITDVDGYYLIDSLLVGSYDVSVAAEGFAPAETTGVEVTEGDTTRVDFALTQKIFIRGDYDANGQILTNDALMELQYIFKVPGYIAPSCEDAADYDDDGDILTNDPLMMLQFIFKVPGYLPPPLPGESCGIDPTEDSLGCDWHEFCMGGGKALAFKPSVSVPGAKDRVVAGETVPVNGVVKVPIDLTTTRRICGFDISMEFDAGLLQFKRVEGGEGYDFYAVDLSQNGVVRIGGVPDIEMANLLEPGAHRIAVVVFGVADVKGDIELCWRNVEVYDPHVQPLRMEWVNGIVKAELPTQFALEQNYPNPFNPSTQIRYALPVDCQVRLEVYNVVGQRVATLVDGHQKAGYKVVSWNASHNASGVYFYKLTSGNYCSIRKMLLLK